MYPQRLTSYFITFTLIHFVFGNDYEIVEEEPISLNSIEKANAGFVCKSEGYFADVNYGCQFYHVCENSNSPYDKPSFVKHTFSCVNGTVFNQMSFTCTRYEDSIPCEASPNYFYLNKRNGDPKAFFLTEEDIFKPAQSSPKHLSSSSSLTSDHSLLFNNNNNNNELNFSNIRSASRSKMSNYNINSNIRLNTRDSNEDTIGANVMDSERKNRLISSMINNYDPMDDNINMGDVYDVSAISKSDSKSVNHQARAPYELTPKITQYPATQSALLKYHPTGTKYEPATKVSTYIPLNSHYEDKISKMRNFQNENEKLIFSTIRDNFSSKNSKSDPIDIPSRGIGHLETLKNTYTGYSNMETSTRSPIEAVTPASPSRKTTFTPATFSRLYVENQKAAKMEQRIPKTTMENRYAYLKNGPTLKAFDHLKQELIKIQNKTPMYSEAINHQEHPISLSKYDQYESDQFQHINSNQYVVPSSIRIIEPNDGTRALPMVDNNKDIINGGQNIQEQSVKISFMNDNRNKMNPNVNHPHQHNNINNNDNNEQKNTFVDYGGTNYKVIKQVKGKNLLIDPSLENDPARDNIIAQVLEMLSKYN